MLERINHKIPDFLLEPSFRFFRHLLVQLIVLLITINIFWDEPDRILADRWGAWLTYYLQINIIIYVNMYLLVPKLLLKGKNLFYILSLPLVTLCIVILIGLLQLAWSLDSPENSSMILESIASMVAFMTFIAGLTTIQLFKYHLGNILKIDELQNATTEIELANLRNQINPHFLFNMLNNANIMAWQDVEKSSYILNKLKDLLRYQVNEGSKENIKLKDDIVFIRDYLELEKTRRDRFKYTIHAEGNTEIEVPPLLFIPFVENAVKHNPENDSYVEIIFRVDQNKLHFECKNPKARLLQNSKEGGIGQENIKKRLELLFEENYKLRLIDERYIYIVVMEIII